MRAQLRAARQYIAYHVFVLSTVVMMVAIDCAPAHAQNAPQYQWLSVYILHVKSDRVGEFESLVKEMTAASAKAGEPPTQVWNVEAGEGGVYHVVQPMVSMGSLDNEKPPMGPAQMALWVQRITNTIDFSKHFIAHMVAQIAAPNAPPATLTTLRTVTVAAGKQDEYIAWLKNDLTPAFQKANMGSVVTQGAFGDSARHIYFAGGVANWAAFDKPNPLVAALGQKAYDTLFDKVEGMVQENVLTVLRPRPDLMAP
jgi:hypothetical protein